MGSAFGNKGKGSAWRDLGGISAADVDREFWVILRMKSNPEAPAFTCTHWVIAGQTNMCWNMPVD